jgi:hypothetical protein
LLGCCWATPEGECKGNRRESFPVTVNHYPSTRVCTRELCFLLRRETPFFHGAFMGRSLYIPYVDFHVH